MTKKELLELIAFGFPGELIDYTRENIPDTIIVQRLKDNNPRATNLVYQHIAKRILAVDDTMKHFLGRRDGD